MEEKEIKAKARKPRAKKESSTAVKKAIPTNDIPV